ncbi:MAG: hypothetical protein ACTHKS_01945 [Gaiellaceae bacterium]
MRHGLDRRHDQSEPGNLEVTLQSPRLHERRVPRRARGLPHSVEGSERAGESETVTSGCDFERTMFVGSGALRERYGFLAAGYPACDATAVVDDPAASIEHDTNRLNILVGFAGTFFRHEQTPTSLSRCLTSEISFVSSSSC